MRGVLLPVCSPVPAAAINLADAKRSISEIRDILTGRYAPVPLATIAEYFDLLAKAGAVRLFP